jgi:hypothetical protein
MRLAARNLAVPDGESASVLELEAADLLSSPDPVLRDGIGYEALARQARRGSSRPWRRASGRPASSSPGARTSDSRSRSFL